MVMEKVEVGEVLEPFLAFLAADRPFAEFSRLAVLSKTWMSMSLKSLKTTPHLILGGGFAESVTDEVVRLALSRVASENLKRVDLSGCHNISAGGMEYILQYIAETCSVVKEVDVIACSNEAVLRALAIRAPVVCRVHSPQTMVYLVSFFYIYTSIYYITIIYIYIHTYMYVHNV